MLVVEKRYQYSADRGRCQKPLLELPHLQSREHTQLAAKLTKFSHAYNLLYSEHL